MTPSPDASYQKLVSSINSSPPQPKNWIQQTEEQRKRLKISLEPYLITRKRFMKKTDRESTPTGSQIKTIIREFKQEVRKIKHHMLTL